MVLSIDKLSEIFRRKKEIGGFCKNGINIIGEIDTPEGTKEAAVIIGKNGLPECGVYEINKNGDPKFIRTLWL